MKKYEIAYIIHPDLENTLDKVTDKVNAFVNANGKIINEDVWGKKRLAYPIVKQNYGIYVILTANLNPLMVAELENLLKITEEVIRFLVIGLEEETVTGKQEKGGKKKAKKEDAEELPKKDETQEIAQVEAKEEVAEEPKKEDEKTEKKSKKKVEKEVSEEERLEELDKKLKQILG